MPFAFKNYDDVWAAADGKLQALLREDLKKAGYLTTNKILDSGFHQITSRSVTYRGIFNCQRLIRIDFKFKHVNGVFFYEQPWFIRHRTSVPDPDSDTIKIGNIATFNLFILGT